MTRYCRLCFIRGKVREASEMVGDVPYCGDCFTNIDKEKKEMPRQVNVDWKAAQSDRDNGMTLAELGEKYDVSIATISKHTKKSGAERGKAEPASRDNVAGAADGRTSPRRPRAVSQNGSAPDEFTVPLETVGRLADLYWAALPLHRKIEIIEEAAAE